MFSSFILYNFYLSLWKVLLLLWKPSSLFYLLYSIKKNPLHVSILKINSKNTYRCICVTNKYCYQSGWLQMKRHELNCVPHWEPWEMQCDAGGEIKAVNDIKHVFHNNLHMPFLTYFHMSVLTILLCQNMRESALKSTGRSMSGIKNNTTVV